MKWPARKSARRSGATRRAPTPRAPREAGAQAQPGEAGPRGRLANYFVRHLQVFFFSLGRLYRNPVSSLMTAAVIGIALALPTGMYVALKNLQAVSGGWDGAAQITLFLKASIDDGQARALADRLSARDDVTDVRTISRAQALEEFRQLSGFGEALGVLEDNPLPAVVVVRPATPGADATEAIAQLHDELRMLPEVDIAQLDRQWLQRLYAIVDIARRAVLVIAGLLALAVLLIVGNTIRLDIQNRREEIEVTKLIGATDAFIRRPFLYGGFWYGLLGGLIAWGLVDLALLALRTPVNRLAGLYESGFSLFALDLGGGLALLVLSTALGLAGSWLAVGRHLNAIEPV